MIFYYWQGGLQPGAPYDKRSPNISAWLLYILARFGGVNLGSYMVRPRTGTTNSWSTHAFGAAWDWGYSVNGVPDNAKRLAVIDFLITNHVKLGVQMIVDEAYDRTWKCYRLELGGPGWKDGAIDGGYWLHIETNPDSWFNATPVAERLAVPTVVDAPTLEDIDMLALDYTTPDGRWVAFTYTGSHLGHTVNGHADNVQRFAGVKRVAVGRDQLEG